jgi:hypothetical protein
MTNITPLPLAATAAEAAGFRITLIKATTAFVASHPGTEGAEVIGTVLPLDYGPNKPGFLAHCLTHYFSDDAEAAVLADAWDSDAEWHRHSREQYLAAYPREALKDEAPAWLSDECARLGFVKEIELGKWRKTGRGDRVIQWRQSQIAAA